MTDLEGLPAMLTVDEAAQVLRIGRKLAYALIAEGKLPVRRYGRVIRVPRAALLAELEEVETDAS